MASPGEFVFEPFERWYQVLAHAGGGATLYYQGPMDYRPVACWCVRKGRKVRVTPPVASEADPFWADEGHLARFKRRVAA